MRFLVNAVKQTLIPGSMSFLLSALGVGVLLLNAGPTLSPYGRVLLTAIALIYLALSLPAVAEALIGRHWETHGVIRTADDARGAPVLVVVGNGSVHYAAGGFTSDQLTRRSVFCAFEAARIYALVEPPLVIATGGSAGTDQRARPESELLRDELVRCGVPAHRIIIESESRTTSEQIANVQRILELRGIAGPILIVTTPAHAPRVLALAKHAALDFVPAITRELRYDEGRTGWRRWWPSFAALRGSESAIYEHLARLRTMYR